MIQIITKHKYILLFIILVFIFVFFVVPKIGKNYEKNNFVNNENTITEKEQEELDAIYNTAKMQDEEFKKDEEQQILQNQQKPSFLNKFTNVAEKQLEVFSAWQERENGLIGIINEAVENYVFPDDPDKEEPDFNIDNFINENE